VSESDGTEPIPLRDDEVAHVNAPPRSGSRPDLRPLGPARSAHELAAATTGAQVEDVLLRSEWYAVPDDTVGGWAVANAPIPVSAHSRDVGVTAIGDFLSERAARHVVDVHNRWLRQFGTGRD
jgi:hypothetical protein